MQTPAFHGQPAVRDRALARLAADAGQRRLVHGILVWKDDAASVAGLLIQSDKPERWVEELGLPQWLATALDSAVIGLSPVDTQAYARECLLAVAPGQDLVPVASRLVRRVLDEAAEAADASSPAVMALLPQLHELLAAAGLGSPVPAAEWRRVRRLATAATDALTSTLQQSLARCVEAACWDPRTSATVVTDVLAQWQALNAAGSDLAYGWAEDDDRRTQGELDGLFAQHRDLLADTQRTVFDLYEEHMPEAAARLRGRYAFARERNAQALARYRELLRQALHG